MGWAEKADSSQLFGCEIVFNRQAIDDRLADDAAESCDGQEDEKDGRNTADDAKSFPKTRIHGQHSLTTTTA